MQELAGAGGWKTRWPILSSSGTYREYQEKLNALDRPGPTTQPIKALPGLAGTLELRGRAVEEPVQGLIGRRHDFPVTHNHTTAKAKANKVTVKNAKGFLPIKPAVTFKSR